MKRFINDKLSHFKVEEERTEVITMLVFLGLQQHASCCPFEKPLRASSLKDLCGERFASLLKSTCVRLVVIVNLVRVYFLQTNK
jgi:hypothetical protein